MDVVGTTWLNQADRQRQLDVSVAAFVQIDEVLQVERNVTLLEITASAKFVCQTIVRLC
jgi:hypothetical protein